MKLLYRVLLFPLLILIIDQILFHTGLYSTWRYSDVVMHLLGGAAIAYGVRYFKHSNKIEEPRWWAVVSTVGITMIAAVMWEWQEFFRDVFVYHAHLLQPSEGDTMKDLFNGMLGAATVALFFK